LARRSQPRTARGEHQRPRGIRSATASVADRPWMRAAKESKGLDAGLRTSIALWRAFTGVLEACRAANTAATIYKRARRFDLLCGSRFSAIWNQRLGDGGPDQRQLEPSAGMALSAGCSSTCGLTSRLAAPPSGGSQPLRHPADTPWRVALGLGAATTAAQRVRGELLARRAAQGCRVPIPSQRTKRRLRVR
jgi:hypothetical protein